MMKYINEHKNKPTYTQMIIDQFNIIKSRSISLIQKETEFGSK